MFRSNRTISYLLFIIADLISLGAVLAGEWTSLRVILFYWLDMVVMMLFLPFILSKASRNKYQVFQAIPAMLMMWVVFYWYYQLLLILGGMIGYHVNEKEPFYELIYPYYQFPLILIAIVLEHIYEYKYFLRDPGEDAAVELAKGFMMRVVLIQVIVWGTMTLLSERKALMNIAFVPILIIILYKTIVFFSHSSRAASNTNTPAG
jgi:hypothetical protein